MTIRILEGVNRHRKTSVRSCNEGGVWPPIKAERDVSRPVGGK